jgi:hypothetical protein
VESRPNERPLHRHAHRMPTGASRSAHHQIRRYVPSTVRRRRCWVGAGSTSQLQRSATLSQRRTVRLGSPIGIGIDRMLYIDDKRNRLIRPRDHYGSGEAKSVRRRRPPPAGDKPVWRAAWLYSTETQSRQRSARLSHLGSPQHAVDAASSVLPRSIRRSLRGDGLIIGGRSEAIFQPEWCDWHPVVWPSTQAGGTSIAGWTVHAPCIRCGRVRQAMWLFGYSTYGFALGQDPLLLHRPGQDKLVAEPPEHLGGSPPHAG